MQNQGTKLEFLDPQRKVVDFKAWQSRRELENAGFEIKQSAPGKVRLLLRIRKTPPILLPYR